MIAVQHPTKQKGTGLGAPCLLSTVKEQTAWSLLEPSVESRRVQGLFQALQAFQEARNLPADIGELSVFRFESLVQLLDVDVGLLEFLQDPRGLLEDVDCGLSFRGRPHARKEAVFPHRSGVVFDRLYFEAGLEEADDVINALQVYVLAYAEYLRAVNDFNYLVSKLKSVSGVFQ